MHIGINGIIGILDYSNTFDASINFARLLAHHTSNNNNNRILTAPRARDLAQTVKKEEKKIETKTNAKKREEKYFDLLTVKLLC